MAAHFCNANLIGADLREANLVGPGMVHCFLRPGGSYGTVLHASATTTEAVRRAIQHSQASYEGSWQYYGINWKTVASGNDESPVLRLRTGPQSRQCCRWRTRRSSSPFVGIRCCPWTIASSPCRPRDPAFDAIEPAIAAFSAMGSAALGRRRATSPQGRSSSLIRIGFFHLDIAEVQTAEGKPHSFVAIDRTSKPFAFVQLVEDANRVTASAFLVALIAAIPYKIHLIPDG